MSAYPASARKRRCSRVIEHGAKIELAFSFNKSNFDHIDELVVHFVAMQVGAMQCTPSDNKQASVCYRCNVDQAKNFGKRLAYASTLPLAHAPASTSHQRVPLSVLLTRALLAYTQEYEKDPAATGLPNLVVWSNVLSHINSHGIEQNAFRRKAILATRAARVTIRHCSELGWLTIEKVKGKRTQTIFRTTKEGDRIRSVGAERATNTNKAWFKRFGPDAVYLHNALREIANHFELAYPQYITGYGVGDESLTGGNFLAAEPGPPRVPARGTEWPVVQRDQTNRESAPASASISHALTHFALDYEAANLGRLGLTTLLFQHLPDEGLKLSEARKLQPIPANDKSFYERHLYIAIEPGKESDGNRLVWPTQKTRIARDAYPFVVSDIEKQWERTYGRERVTKIREALEAMNERFDQDLPEYPATTQWMTPWYRPFLLTTSETMAVT